MRGAALIKNLTWSRFNSLAKNKIVQSSYIWAITVPVFAKLLSSINQDHQVLIPGTNLRITLGIPFTWELLYYTAISFSIASIIYSLACPEIVQKYEKFSDFETEGKGQDQLLGYAYGFQYGRFKNNANCLPAKELAYFIKIGCPRYHGIDSESTYYQEAVVNYDKEENNGLDPKNLHIDHQKFNEVFWFLRNYFDQTKPIARFITALSYTIGFTLIGVIAIQNLFFIASHHFFQ